jgi:uncharacterized protein YdbL (DUF1318 family)
VISLFWVTACVTVNVYFPAAAAERAADEIIRDVWQAPAIQENTPPVPVPSQQEGNALRVLQRHIVLWEGVINILMPSVQAAANININTPRINQLRQAMAARFKHLAPYFTNGAVGLTRDGLLMVRDLNAVPLSKRNEVKRLVAEDNRDRRALYQEIAKANGHPEWENEIQATFAREWINNARSGWWYQGAGGWRQK